MNDSQMIAGWRMDLNRILLVFNVGSAVSVLPLLTVQPQTELGLNIYGTISDVRDGVAKTHAVVSEVQRDAAGTHAVVVDTHAVVAEVQRNVADTRIMVSDIHRQVLGDPGGANHQHLSVSSARTMLTTKYVLTVSRIKPGQQPRLLSGPASYICT